MGSNYGLRIAKVDRPLLAHASPIIDTAISDAMKIDQIEMLAARFDKMISSYRQFNWIFSNKVKFGTLMSLLEKYNEGLFEITEHFFFSTRMSFC